MLEPNNTPAEAELLSLNATPQIFSGSTSLADPDYYRFQLAGRSSLNLSLTELTGNADLQLLNGAEQVIQASVNTGTLAESLNLTLEAGTYYLKVFSDEPSETPYSLNAQVQIADLQPKLLWRNYANGQNVFWKMAGTTLESIAPLAPLTDPNWQIQATGDFNQDSEQDLVWRNTANGQNYLWLMAGNQLIQEMELAPPVTDPNWRIGGTGDFNADGKTDILWRNYSDGSNLVWLMDGTAVIGMPWLPAAPDPAWQIATTGDFNADGKTDIVWRNATTGANLIWLMDGTALTGSVDLGSVPLDWRIGGAADFNADGRTDIVWRNYVTGANLVWLMDGV